jgi:predicted  nucleic acid-binding Zn-ribbon protein
MASSTSNLTAIADKIKRKRLEVQILRKRCEAQQDAWTRAGDEGQRNQAKISWDVEERRLEAAQEDLAALRREKELLSGQSAWQGKSHIADTLQVLHHKQLGRLRDSGTGVMPG